VLAGDGEEAKAVPRNRFAGTGAVESNHPTN
jgi:hypothetical protein